MADDLRYRITNLFQRRVANPLMRRLPIQTLLETTGRTSGQPRRTPLGGSRVGNEFWFVSEFGEKSQYVKDIKANRMFGSGCGAAGTTASPIWFLTTIRRNGCARCRSSTASACAPSAPTCSRSGSISPTDPLTTRP
jgi:F420H(2)-dependent quinone reductase